MDYIILYYVYTHIYIFIRFLEIDIWNDMGGLVYELKNTDF